MAASLATLVMLPVGLVAGCSETAGFLLSLGGDEPSATRPAAVSSTAAPAQGPPWMLPIATDQDDTVGRCVTISGTGAPKPGFALVVGVHLRLDEAELRVKKTFYPLRVIRRGLLEPGRPWRTTPTLAIGPPVLKATTSFDVFLAIIPEEQARLLDNDMAATKAHNLEELADRKIDIIQSKKVTRRPSPSAESCEG